jgi:hypothetical protein
MIFLLRNLFSFYQNFASMALGMTFFLAWASLRFENLRLMPVLGLKLLSYGVIFYVISSYKKNELYYYLNIGISERKLWLLTLLPDFGFFLMAIYLSKLWS